jgi:hypothetical protein
VSYLDDELAILPRWEGRCNWLYLDNVNPVPNPTTGIGNLIANIQAMLALPWQTPQGATATVPEVTTEWNRVKQMRGGLVASAYKSPGGLVLTDAAIDKMVMAKLNEFDADLRRDFPGYDSYPDSVKTRLLDMEWNLGDARLKGTYIHFDAAVAQRNWPLAAQECGRNTNQPAFHARNVWTAQGFLEAK